jgi:hypothetical protein
MSEEPSHFDKEFKRRHMENLMKPLTENNERAPEPGDVYKYGGLADALQGRWLITSNRTDIDGYYSALHIDDDFTADGLHSSLFDCQMKYLGNALKSVELCAGLGGDPAAAIAELREQLSQVTSDLRRWIQKRQSN